MGFEPMKAFGGGRMNVEGEDNEFMKTLLAFVLVQTMRAHSLLVLLVSHASKRADQARYFDFS